MKGILILWMLSLNIIVDGHKNLPMAGVGRFARSAILPPTGVKELVPMILSDRIFRRGGFPVLRVSRFGSSGW